MGYLRLCGSQSGTAGLRSSGNIAFMAIPSHSL